MQVRSCQIRFGEEKLNKFERRKLNLIQGSVAKSIIRLEEKLDKFEIRKLYLK